jgi:hypothetical protein
LLPPDIREGVLSCVITFDERLNAEKALIAAAVENTPPSPRRKLLD